MDFESKYEIVRTAVFICDRNFTRVALQFPDELLRDSVRVVTSLRTKVQSLTESNSDANVEQRDVQLYIMADTTYGSCCVDEVGASHVNAECVVHYGHTCLSPTSTLPALFVFGRGSIDAHVCAKSIADCLLTSGKPIVVLFGLEYSHAVERIKEAMVVESSRLRGSNLVVHYADAICAAMHPTQDSQTHDNKIHIGNLGSFDGFKINGDLPHKNVQVSRTLESSYCGKTDSTTSGARYCLGGLVWNLPEGHQMEDYLLLWIGSENPAFANIVLTYNACEIVRYDTVENRLVKDVCHQKRILKRRYYLVEKAKDANIIGILVGTLGVAGYLHMIHQMKELIQAAGKKAYTLVMGRPNPAKLANFPECDVFIYVACAQTALLDCKEFLAPVITPFEAMLAFNRGSQWNGTYVMEFQNLMAFLPQDARNSTEEARFSFLQGGYVGDFDSQEDREVQRERGLVLAEITEKSLIVEEKYPTSIFVKGTAKSGEEFLSSRSYRGLDMVSEKTSTCSFVIGRSGKASGYEDEKRNPDYL